MKRCLTEIETADYVNTLRSDDLDALEEKIKLHVQGCYECRTAVWEVYTFLVNNLPKYEKKENSVS